MRARPNPVINAAADPRSPVSVDDFYAIQRLVHQYSDAVVYRDVEQWGECWAHDAVWDLGRGRGIVGRPAIVGLWLKAMDSMEAVVQLTHNGDVWRTNGDADRACGRWYVSERFRRSGGEAGVLLANYDDTYVCTADGWRFASRSLRPHYRGPPDLSADFLNTADRLRTAPQSQETAT